MHTHVYSNRRAEAIIAVDHRKRPRHTLYDILLQKQLEKEGHFIFVLSPAFFLPSKAPNSSTNRRQQPTRRSFLSFGNNVPTGVSAKAILVLSRVYRKLKTNHQSLSFCRPLDTSIHESLPVSSEGAERFTRGSNQNTQYTHPPDCAIPKSQNPKINTQHDSIRTFGPETGRGRPA